jgi:hypothetical protein
MKGGKISQWVSPFYGLTLSPEDKLRVHEEISTLYYNSNGGINHDEAYSMPIFLRAFNIRWLINQKEKEKQSQEKQTNSTPKSPPSRISPRNPVK